MEIFTKKHAQLLYYRFSVIYGEKFIKPFHDEKFRSIWFDEWTSGLSGIDVSLMKNTLEHCKKNLDWAPSIAEFRRICELFSGVPSVDQCLSLAVRGDFSHPITAITYDKVGSWTMKNSKEADLLIKFKSSYIEALTLFRNNPESAWEKLISFKDCCALPPPSSKIPSHQEIIGFRERFKKYQEMASADKLNLKPQDHPDWAKEKITYGNKQFDEFLFNERKRYLIGLDEIVAGTLSRDDWYDRTRYIRENEAAERIKHNPPRDLDTNNEKIPLRSFYGARRANDYWKN